MSHTIKAMTVMAPHVVTDVDPDTHVSQLDIGDEETSQGFFRFVVDVECECGAHFTGRRHAMNDYKEHLDEAQ